MAEPNEIAGGDKAAAPESKPESSQAELPTVESPPLSPAETLSEPVLDKQMKPAVTDVKPAAPEAKPESDKPAAADTPKPRIAMPRVKIPPLKIPTVKIPDVKLSAPRISRRMRRRAALAATVMLAAGLGAAVGAIANRPPVQAPLKPDTALIEENHALQRSVARLNKDLTTLKASLESAARDSRTQIAKVTERLSERIDKAIETTGSIGKPAATATAASPPAIDPAPLPQPRPAIVQGWTVRELRGRVFVENRGEYFQVAPGVPLPGLGRVESIRREGDSLVVVTAKGLITAAQSTASIRPRPHYPPPPWRPY